MSFATIRARVEAALTSWTACPIAWPDSDFQPPTQSADPSTPASYLVADVYENNAKLSDFAGGAEIDGRVAIWIWTEKRAGDDLVRTHAENLRTAFKGANSVDIFFLEPSLGDARILGEPQTWYGRQLSVPFKQFR